MDVTAAEARDAIARSAHAPAETIEQRIRAALVALRTTYASRCSEPSTLSWGWRIADWRKNPVSFATAKH